MPNDTYGYGALQTEMLDILKRFIGLCETYQCAYWACGGTLIGAIRHNGFIPWDDDLDVFMPRPDYEKLWAHKEEINASGPMKLVRTTREKNYHHRVMRLVDTETTFINARCIHEDIEHGVYIDIIPMDACAKNPFSRLGQIVSSIFFSVYNVQTLPELHGGKAYRALVGTLLKLVPSPERRYRIWSRNEKRMQKAEWGTTPKAVELACSLGVLLRPYPAEWFAAVEKHPFEDTEINIPIGYDAYLRQVFGDYMLLPPEEKRIPRHNTVKLDLENSYTKYRGIEYLAEK